MAKPRNLLLFLSLLISTCSFGQEYLLLEKVGSTKRIKFQAGDQLKFKLRSADSLYMEHISGAFDTHVAFGNMVVNYPDFKKIWIYKPTFLDTRIKFIMLAAGTMFFMVDTFNRTVNNDRTMVSREALLVLGTGFTIGGIIHLSQVRWFRPGGNKQVRYLDMRMMEK